MLLWPRFPSWFYYLFISSLLFFPGCSKPVLKMPDSLPSIIKEYKHITLHAGDVGMQNAGVYLDKGDTYSILATGSMDLCSKGGCSERDVRPEHGGRLMMRVGKNPPYHTILYGENSHTSIAICSGYLYLGYRQGKVDWYGEPLKPAKYRNDMGAFSVDIIVWAKENWVQIAHFFDEMKEKDPENKAILHALYEANTYRRLFLAYRKTSKQIEQTKKELQKLKKKPEKEKREANEKEKILHLETKLAKLMETVKKLDDLIRKQDEERNRSNLLNAKLSEIRKEKDLLEKKLDTEEDIKQQLTASLKERETTYQKQQTLVASLYERERQLKSKLFQLEETVRKSEENQKELGKLEIRARELDEKVEQAKQTKEVDTLKAELKKVLHDKSNLEKKANYLKTRESTLKDEVNSHRSLAEKTRIEAKNAKKELAATRVRERKLSNQVDELKVHLNRGMAPVIVVSRPKDGTKIESSTTMLHIIVVDDRGIENVNVYLNGEQVTGEMGKGLFVAGTQAQKILNKIDLTRRLKLQYGRNTVRVSTTDTDGLSKEEEVTVIREKERGKIWAVVIGINDYKNVRDLRYALNDARSFKEYLTEYIGMPDDNIFFLTNQDATKSKIQSLLGTKIRRLAGKEDTVIIFYAGHGAVETDPLDPDGDGFEKYLLPYDASLNDLYSTSIAMKEIKTIFQRIRADRLIFIADTCYSGATGGRTMLAYKSRATLSERFFERISRGKGRVIISACSANEISKEDDNFKHGIFSYYLLKGLKGEADYDADGIITVNELFSFLSRKVPAASGQDQHPVKKGETEGELVIGRKK